MRVLLLSNIYPTRSTPTGATFIRSRIRALTGHGVEVVPVAVWPSWTAPARLLRAPFGRFRDDPPVEPFMSSTVPLGPWHAYRRRLDSRSGRRWLDDITDAVLGHVPGPVDVVHAHGMYDLPAGLVAEHAAQRLDLPFVVSMHGTDVNMVMPHRTALYSRVLSRASATTYVSTALRDRAHALVPPHPRAYVIPNGVDPSVFRPGPRATAPSVVYVGNLERVKGVDRLPAIWREVRAAEPSARLTVVGTGALRSSLRRSLDDPSVRFLGRMGQPGVAQEMARAHVLVLPSRAEGWPTVIMEAYASGTPVVGTAVGGIPEALVDTDCLVPVGPALERRFARAVVRVLRAGESSRAGLVAAARPYDWSRVVAREIEIYRSC